MPVLQIDNLSKQYGSFKAVNSLSMSVEKGSVYGFLGVNGAGKTTTIRMITGLAKPTGGEITVCGEKVRFGKCSVQRHIGYLPDVPEFYGYMKPREYLMLCGRLCGLDTKKVREKCGELLPLVGLDGVHRNISGFSRGMKQRLGIAQALINEPELLILDEPTSALDPVGRRELLNIIASLRGRVTVLFSTHILSDVERVCDTVGILNKGSLALSGNLSVLREKYAGHRVIIETGGEDDNRKKLKEKLSALPYVKETKEDGSALTLSCSDTQRLGAEICPILSELTLTLIRYEHVEPQLEDVFMEVIRGE